MAGKCPESLEAQFIEDCARLTTAALTEKYGKSATTIRDWRLNLYRRGKLLWWPGIQVHEDNEYDDYLEIQGDVMVVGDLEIPFHDAELLGYMVAVAMKFGVKQLVVAGDFLAFDEFSNWPSEEGDTKRTLADTLWSGGDVLKSLFEWFDEISIIKGNHEQRGTRRKELALFQLMEQTWSELGSLNISYYKWCRAVSGGKTFRIEHPGNYSRVPGAVVRDRAEIEQESTLGAHTHHCSWSVTKDGRFEAVDLGHCTRPEQRWYKTVNGTTRHPKWVAGFWMIRKGYLYGFPKDFTDWNFWLEER